MADFHKLSADIANLQTIQDKTQLLKLRALIDSYLDQLPKEKIGPNVPRDQLKLVYKKMRESKVCDIDEAVVQFTLDMINFEGERFNRQDYAYLINCELENCEDNVYFQAPQYMLMLYYIHKLNV